MHIIQKCFVLVDPLFWGRGAVKQGQGNRQVWLYQPGKAWCRFSEDLSPPLNSVCSCCEERHYLECTGHKSWMRGEEKGGTRSCLGKWAHGRVWFWQDEALGICWYLGSGAAALTMTQGHRGSPDSPLPDLSALGFVTRECCCCTCDVLLGFFGKKGSPTAEGLYKNSRCTTCKECECLQLERGQMFKNKQEKTFTPLLPSVPLLHMFITLILYRRNRELRAGF